MRPDGLQTIGAVRGYLDGVARAGMPPEQRSEVRAALKLLANAQLELSELAGLLRTESAELLALCAGTAALTGVQEPEQRAPELDATLPELQEHHAHARRASAQAILALQLQARDGSGPALDLLDRFYVALGRHAERRLPWQSVFPVPTLEQGASR
ncbi:MAG TPA: hypothetical protein VHX88_14635 [Solirubrobacteraceae bacterium]|jgi:hypothetical protein|nr:hypothetical protein [Solirubrobacteraceae bacterium]